MPYISPKQNILPTGRAPAEATCMQTRAALQALIKDFPVAAGDAPTTPLLPVVAAVPAPAAPPRPTSTTTPNKANLPRSSRSRNRTATKDAAPLPPPPPPSLPEGHWEVASDKSIGLRREVHYTWKVDGEKKPGTVARAVVTLEPADTAGQQKGCIKPHGQKVRQANLRVSFDPSLGEVEETAAETSAEPLAEPVVIIEAAQVETTVVTVRPFNVWDIPDIEGVSSR